MFRKAGSYLFFTIWCALTPMTAYAASWSLNTWVKSPGGYMVSRNGANQTSANGSVFKSYTTHATMPFTVNANGGYSISNLTVNGSAISAAAGQTTYSGTVAGMTSQSVFVTYGATSYNESATATAGGTVSPASISPVYYGTQVTPQYFTFTPNAGFALQTLAITNATASCSSDGGVTYAACATPYTANTTVKVKVSAITGNVTLVGTFFGPPVAKIGVPQTVMPGSFVTLDGSGSTGTITSYMWTQTSGPGSVTLSDPTAVSPTFTAPVTVGTYVFKLTVQPGGSYATTSVLVTSDPAAAARSQCQNCHDTNSIGVQANVFGNWQASTHNNTTTPIMCYACHIGANTGGHPGPALSTLGNICRNCHINAQGNVANHPFPIGTSTCVSCHDPHSTTGSIASAQGAPHYNNVTSAGYPASYVTSRAACEDCHYDDSTTGNLNATSRHAWAQSGHAATTALPWIDYDFKTRSGCVQCHTTTGFIAYSTGKVTAAWGDAADKTKEVLTCKGCHSDVTTGAVRSATPVKPFADDAYVNRNVGESNICMDCHSGRNNGKSITKLVGSANFANQSFVTPHYLAAGGVLHGQGAYNFPSQSYTFYSSNSHRKIGLGNALNTGTAGPCVVCHKNASGHTFQVASAGSIPTVCANCHGAAMTFASLTSARTSAANALSVLNAALSSQGYTYSPSYPYFTNTNWGSDQAGANKMGAAFNYVLLVKEPGAYAHNEAYTKQLIIDSIDAVSHNGTVTGSIDDVLASLVNSNAISQQAADSLTAYKTSSNCGSCHPLASLRGAHAAHIGTLLPTAYGDTANYSTTTEYRFGCGNCHPTAAISHTDGRIDVTLVSTSDGSLRSKNDPNVVTGGIGNTGSGITGTTGVSVVCSAAYCHSNGGFGGALAYVASPDWYGGSYNGDKCAMCHGNAPTTGAHAKHTVSIHSGLVADADGNLIPAAAAAGTIAGHGDPAQATAISCDICHSATVKSTANDKGTLCVSCHSSVAKGTPVLDKTVHLNGQVDIALKDVQVKTKAQLAPESFGSYSTIWTRTTYKVDTGSFDASKQSLAQGMWDGTGKNCSNVACHNGSPANWNSTLSCVACHSKL